MKVNLRKVKVNSLFTDQFTKQVNDRLSPLLDRFRFAPDIARGRSGYYSLRDFLRLANRDNVPDHSWLSKTRCRLPHEVHEKVFGWVLALVAERGLVKGERIGVDGSTMEPSPWSTAK